MTSLLFLIPIALGMGLIGLLAFLWSVRSGQFEDLDGAGARVLFDDERPLPPLHTVSRRSEPITGPQSPAPPSGGSATRHVARGDSRRRTRSP